SVGTLACGLMPSMLAALDDGPRRRKPTQLNLGRRTGRRWTTHGSRPRVVAGESGGSAYPPEVGGSSGRLTTSSGVSLTITLALAQTYETSPPCFALSGALSRTARNSGTTRSHSGVYGRTV